MQLHKTKHRIIVLGGYGNFGKRLSELLVSDPQYEILVAGRSVEKAQKLVAKIKKERPDANIESIRLDWQASDFSEQLTSTKADLLIHAAGPFQTQDYCVAKACIDSKIHYVDLSDARDFVLNITQLDQAAKEHNVVVISGASSVPGLSSAVIDAYYPKFGILREIDFGISPGNKVERGHATIAAILDYVGKPFLRLERGEWKTVYGWQNLYKHYYGDNIGMRWHANLDIPDLILFPNRYPSLETVRFHAGLEISFLHWLMWKMSWLRRMKIIKNWGIYSKYISRVSQLFDRLGTDTSGMYIHLAGSNLDYQPLDINWILVAESGDGPYIPVLPGVILVKKILKGMVPPGAQPCLGLFSLEEFNNMSRAWKIYSIVEEKVS